MNPLKSAMSLPTRLLATIHPAGAWRDYGYPKPQSLVIVSSDPEDNPEKAFTSPRLIQQGYVAAPNNPFNLLNNQDFASAMPCLVTMRPLGFRVWDFFVGFNETVCFQSCL